MQLFLVDRRCASEEARWHARQQTYCSYRPGYFEPRQVPPLQRTVLGCIENAFFQVVQHSSTGVFPSPWAEAVSVLASTVASMVKYRYGMANANLREDDRTWRRDLETLRHAELTHLAALLRIPSPRPGKGSVALISLSLIATGLAPVS